MKIWLSALVVLASVSSVWADVGPKRPLPPPQPDASVPFVIETTNNVGPAKLIIPKKFVGAMKASLDHQEKDTAVASNGSRVATILAGIFLTLSVAFTGLWVIRQRSVFGNRAVAIMIASLLVMGIGAAIVLANAPPPPLPAAKAADNSDKVVIEVVEQGDAVKLIVSKGRLARLGAGVGVPVPLPAPVPQPAPVPGVKPAPGAVLPGSPPKQIID
jgi:hypothetical protein